MSRSEIIADLASGGDDVGSVTLHRVSMPLRQALTSSHGTEARRESTLVQVDLVDGSSGWGECVALARPTYTDEYADGAYLALRDVIVPGWYAGAAPVVGHPMAAAALEGALVDARLRARGRSLVDALGATRPSVATAAVVGRTDTLDALLERVAGLIERSIDAVSLKIAPGWDVEPLRAVRAAWPSLGLAADANGAYLAADADHLASLAPLGLHHLEQPLPAGDLEGLRAVRAAIGAAVALDESIASVEDLDAAVRVGGVDAVNVKPARVGGLAPALRLVARAIELGLALYVGGMLETGVGRAHALALAALDELSWPTHLGPSDRYFDRDLTEAILLDGRGELVVPVGPGIGVTPDPSRVHEIEIDRAVVRAGPA